MVRWQARSVQLPTRHLSKVDSRLDRLKRSSLAECFSDAPTEQRDYSAIDSMKSVAGMGQR